MAKTKCDPNAPFAFKIGDVVEFQVGPRVGTSIGRIARINPANTTIQDIDHYGCADGQKGARELYVPRGRILGLATVDPEIVAERLATLKPKAPRKTRMVHSFEGGIHQYMDRTAPSKAALQDEAMISRLDKILRKYNKELSKIEDLMSEQTKQELAAYVMITDGDQESIVKSAHGYCKLLLRRAKQAVKRVGNATIKATHAVVAAEQQAAV